MPRKLSKAVAKIYEAVEELRQEFPGRPFTSVLRSGRCISLEPSIRKSYAFENAMTVRDSSARCPIRCVSGDGSKKGERPGGRKVGSRNKATIEREEKVRLELERQAEIDRQRAAGVAGNAAEEKAAGVKLAKDVLEEFYAAVRRDSYGCSSFPNVARGET